MTDKTSYEFRPAINKHLIRFFYDFWCSAGNLGKNFKRKVISLSKIQGSETVVDIGCGTGVLLIEVAKNHPKANLIGIDPDEMVLGIAKQRFDKLGINAKLFQEYAEKLSLENNSVDLVISSLVFHHFPNEIKQTACNEIYRILKPGGRVAIADFGPRRKSPYLFEKKEYMQGNLQGMIPVCMEKSGFKNVTEIGKYFPGVSIYGGVK